MSKVHTVETLRARITGTAGGGWRSPDTVKAIACADGFRVSVQASRSHYCLPRQDGADWTHVELGFPNRPIPTFLEYRDGSAPDERNVFGYVPIEMVVALINEHGGEVV